jgi:hypothetical protein
MKKLSLILLLSLFSLAAFHILKSRAAEPGTFQVSEFATIRWAGRDNTHLIRPNGKVDKLKPLFERFPRPEGGGIDDRAYYMSIAMNAVAREGYEFAGMTSDEIVMKRPLVR